MKRSALSEDQFQLLENALARYGAVVTFAQLQALLNRDVQYTRKRVSKLVGDGWLTRLKKGLYAISDLSMRGSLSISHYAVANQLVEQSYISFLSALQFHGMYDQLLAAVRSVALQRYPATIVGGITYHFVTTRPQYSYGWENHVIEGLAVKVASVEKALVDLVQFHRTPYSTDIVFQTFQEYREGIDLDTLTTHVLRANLTTRRIFGFLYECNALDTRALLQAVEGKASVSSISTRENQRYHHQWKLYYDSYFEKYVLPNNHPAAA
jgi:predicted transcriptional regulator of viral defense system